MALDLNDLLHNCEIDPSTVMVMRHRPTEKDLRAALPGLAADRLQIYNAYQSVHGETVENSLSKKDWLASFIGHKPGSALFVGLFRVAGFERISVATYRRNPDNKLLMELGSRSPRPGRKPIWFDLRVSSQLQDYRGRLVVGWPGIERSWWRRAERNCFPVEAITEECLLVTRVPEASSFVATWAQLKVLPSSWRAAISQWRGVYYIHDRLAGKGYVGSACGSENILGRWLGYAATGHGGNKLLRARDPSNLEFSILQLTASDTPPGEVLGLEARWKDRLHTRSPGGLNAN